MVVCNLLLSLVIFMASPLRIRTSICLDCTSDLDELSGISVCHFGATAMRVPLMIAFLIERSLKELIAPYYY